MRLELDALIVSRSSNGCGQVREAFQSDWSKGGRLLHSALKGAQHPPVDSVDAIDKVQTVQVQLLRARRKTHVSFALCMTTYICL